MTYCLFAARVVSFVPERSELFPLSLIHYDVNNKKINRDVFSFINILLFGNENTKEIQKEL